MGYSAEISRGNPTCFLFLIDQSGSMADRFGLGEATMSKAEGAATAINRLLQELVLTCAKEEGIRDYFHLGVIGYGNSVASGFAGSLAGRDLVPISEVGNNPARVEDRVKKMDDGAGGIIDKKVRFPIWFDPVSNGGTPMCQTFQKAEGILQGWLAAHPTCFPPVVFHITDGESTDGDPRERMAAVTRLSSSDGNVLLFNLSLSSNPQARSITFPNAVAGLPDEFARMLFETASQLTPFMCTVANQHGFGVAEGARAFILNAEPVHVAQAFDIGTRPSNLR